MLPNFPVWGFPKGRYEEMSGSAKDQFVLALNAFLMRLNGVEDRMRIANYPLHPTQRLQLIALLIKVGGRSPVNVLAEWEIDKENFINDLISINDLFLRNWHAVARDARCPLPEERQRAIEHAGAVMIQTWDRIKLPVNRHQLEQSAVTFIMMMTKAIG